MRDIMSSRIYTIPHINYICREVLDDWLDRQIKSNDLSNPEAAKAYENVKNQISGMSYISIKERID